MFPLSRNRAAPTGRALIFAVAGTTILPIAAVAFVAARAAVGGSPRTSHSPVSHGLDTTGHFLVSAAVVLAAALCGGLLARRLGQPPVIGEICAGLAVGPSLLGHAAPGAAAWLFPPAVLPMLGGLSQLGLVLFMFGVGRELAGVRLKGAARQALLVSQASLLVPFAAGAAVALPLFGRYGGDAGHPLAFVLFLGCALSITAFPVLARILFDLRLTYTLPGQLSLFAAAVGDGGSWLVLAAILTLVNGGDASQLLVNGLLAALIVAFFLVPLRRALARWTETGHNSSGPPAGSTATVLLAVGVLAASALTAAVGIHQLIGGLLMGLAWPATHTGATAVADRLTAVPKTVLLPFFFFTFGLTTDLSTLVWDGPTLATLAVLLVAAVGAKIIGPTLCARVTGAQWRPAIALGVLLNSRGLTELVVIQIGYQTQIIDRSLAGILTIVALVTTMMTGPLLRLLGYGSHEPDEPQGRTEALAEAPDLKAVTADPSPSREERQAGDLS
ncbi:cation:proton antiporter [Streptomyces sp. BBFR2]|uniref:cation:proton antiporter n=1 Tax=Streptomyces sp. BBFR2 TaxID=3372854 RepID=UPI0037D9B38F